LNRLQERRFAPDAKITVPGGEPIRKFLRPVAAYLAEDFMVRKHDEIQR